MNLKCTTGSYHHLHGAESFSCWWHISQETVRLCGSRRFITVITSHRTNHNSIITSIPWRTDGWYPRYDASWPVVHRDQSPATSQRTDSLLIPSSYNLHYAMLHAVQEHTSAALCLLGWRHVINSRRRIKYRACTFYQCRPFVVHKQQKGSRDHQSEPNWYHPYCLLHVSVFLKIHNQATKKYTKKENFNTNDQNYTFPGSWVLNFRETGTVLAWTK
jgi:hypothetical protein